MKLQHDLEISQRMNATSAARNYFQDITRNFQALFYMRCMAMICLWDVLSVVLIGIIALALEMASIQFMYYTYVKYSR